MLATTALCVILSPWFVHTQRSVAADPPSDWSAEFEDYEFEGEREGEVDETQEDDAASPEAEAPVNKARADHGMGGALRLVGAYSHYYDAANQLGLQDDAMLATVGRFLIDHRAREFKFEFNAFAELGRLPASGQGLGGAFGTASTSVSAYRHEYLTVSFWDEQSQAGQLRGAVGVDRMRFGWERGRWLVEAGRFPVSHSVTTFWTPNDFFAPFAANAINKIYKPGIDALRVSVAPGQLSSLEVLVAPGFRDGYELAWSHSAAIVRGSMVVGGFDLALMGGKVAQRWVAGASFQGTLAGVMGVRGEGHVGVPDLDGRGYAGVDKTRGVHGRLAVGTNFNFDWQSSSLSFEYALFSDGATQAQDYITRAQLRFPDDLPYLARHYVSGAFAAEIIPILHASVLAMVNANDGGGLVGTSLNYSVSDEADLSLGAFIPWGAGPKAPLPGSLLPRLGSEFGTAPLSVFLESRIFF